ncbi:MAG: phosphoribosylanthranilate isomerase [Candidatus Latescibacterota bacterium]|nr:MAG: phosphoribosylanthranilate isomerase [Candidatus Latescibacterota bacterium]
MAERMRIKFCGLRRIADVREAVHLGADFLGFVFAEGSPRQLEPGSAEALLDAVDTAGARRVGVFRDQPPTFVNEVARRCRLDLVQLHGRESARAFGELELPAIVVLQAPAAGSNRAPDLRRLDELSPFAALIDAEDAAGRSGGLGVSVPPATAQRMLAQLPPGTRAFLAGGLTPENVGERVRLRPYALDVSSGIESAPGIKDPQRMRAFVQAVRQASRNWR